MVGWHSKDKVEARMEVLGLAKSQLPRFVARGYIEPPTRIGLGRGKGTNSFYPPETIKRIQIVASISKLTNRVPAILTALLTNKYEVPSEALRGYVVREMRLRRDEAKRTLRHLRKKEKRQKQLSDSDSFLKSAAMVAMGQNPGFEPTWLVSDKDFDRRTGPVLKAFHGSRIPGGLRIKAIEEPMITDNSFARVGYRRLAKSVAELNDGEFKIAFVLGWFFSEPKHCYAALRIAPNAGLLRQLLSALKSKDSWWRDVAHNAGIFCGLILMPGALMPFVNLMQLASAKMIRS